MLKKMLLVLFHFYGASAFGLDTDYFESHLEDPLTREALVYPSSLSLSGPWHSRNMTEEELTKAKRLHGIATSQITGTLSAAYFEELTKFVGFLEENAESLLAGRPSLYVHTEGWLRTPVLMYSDKTIYILFKKSDPKSTKGGYKTFGRALDFHKESLVANLSVPVPNSNSLKKLLRELSIMEELKEIPFVLNFHRAAMYEGHVSDPKVIRKAALSEGTGVEQSSISGKKPKLLSYKLAIQAPLFDRDLSITKASPLGSAAPFQSLTGLIQASLIMVNTLHKIHERGFMHRDIKPANFFVNHGQITPYLADFGLTEHKSWNTFGQSISGSRGYLDPKMCESKLTLECACINFSAAKAFDTFALGLTLLELLKALPESQDPRVKESQKRFWVPFHETLYEMNLKALPKAGAGSNSTQTFEELSSKLDQVYNTYTLGFHARLEVTPRDRFEQIILKMLHPAPNQRPKLPQISKELSGLLALATAK